VLWDVDGTLITSHGVTARAFIDAVEQVTGRRAAPRRGELLPGNDWIQSSAELILELRSL
jgi:phosphoglycolate phosphatase-like HAD superfamily hydrolase